MSDSNLVPLMYRAQLENRGKIQYAGNPEPAQKWVKQWLEGCPPVPKTSDIPRQNISNWRQNTVQPRLKVKMPQFGAKVQTWHYTFDWRLVTNSGQDEGVIRPVIGAKGLPYYPGSSMKGAFLRACRQMCTPQEVLDYCGGEVIEAGEKKTKPGMLRFHGGYPVDMSWGNEKRLVDVVHSQERRQVIGDIKTSANVQISLYKTRFKFGISSVKELDTMEWDKIRQIWEQALLEGIGSRVSAGYGKVRELVNIDKIAASVNLRGEGLASLLLTKDTNGNKIPEFRPNMFKAALRGHTLRLLAGVTDGNTAQFLTKQLWGGISESGDGTFVGKLGINFQIDDKGLVLAEHLYYQKGTRAISMPTYNLKSGKLDIIAVEQISEKEKEFITLLIKFSLLLGGFGKSWRRIHHKRFFQDYFNNNDKPMIGCHWNLTQLSESFCVTAPKDKLDNIANFLSSIQDTTRKCFGLPSNNNYEQNWREVWHPQKVQVWGRIAEDKFDSEAIKWFHRDNFIKRTSLTGTIGGAGISSKVGRIWHRMYPLYVKTGDVFKHKSNEEKQFKYVELLTIFPDNSRITNDFIVFLDQNSTFTKIYS